MGAADVSDLELAPDLEPSFRSFLKTVPNTIGILIQDPVNRRLIEAAAVQLELHASAIDQADLDLETLCTFDIIVAEQPSASLIKAVFEDAANGMESIYPALVAAYSGKQAPELPDNRFDGVLLLPLKPAPLVAQLSLILYAHRSFARRYNSALEELRLNRRIFRSVTSGISVASATQPDIPLLYVNPAFEVMTGYSLEEVMGKNCRFLQRDDHNQPGITHLREAIRDQREIIVVIRNYRKDSTPFWNEFSLSPIRNRDGKLTHFVGIQTDVTARVEFEAALRESEKLAAVGRLAATIAHEINNPLESVMNLIYLAQNSKTPGDTDRYLATADQELRRVALITQQSLRFYKQSSKPQAVLPADMLDSVLDVYASQIANINVTSHRRDRAHTPITCLESEIRQVLNNLVRNAIDALRGTGGQSGGQLYIRTRNATHWRSGATGVIITVADNGTGMSRETIKQIFTAFFSTKGIGGTGLGLWVSAEIVNRHQGCFLVRSSQRPGHSGTVFELFLPFQSTVA